MRWIRISRPAWFEQALCHGTGDPSFFPERHHSSQRAKRLCADCPARLPCLEMALADPSLVGVWGGTSEIDRDRMRGEL